MPSFPRSATAMADQPRRHLLVSTHLNGNAMKRALPCFPAGVWGFAARSLCFSQTPDAMALETLYLAFDTWHGVTQIWPLGGLFRGARSLPCHSGCTNRCGSSLASMHSDVEVLPRCLPISTRHQRANLTGMRRSWRCDVSRIESRAWEVSSNRPFLDAAHQRDTLDCRRNTWLLVFRRSPNDFLLLVSAIISHEEGDW